MPPSLTEQLDNLYTTTWELRKGEAHDNIFTATPFWFWMKEKGKFKTEAGHRFIMEPLEYAKNDGVTWVAKGDATDLNDFEFLTESKWDWRYLAVPIVRFGVDDQQNRGRAAIIKLMNAKLNNAENSLIDTIETAYAGAQSGNSIYGLQDLVPNDPTTGTVGGINSADYTWFRNQTKDMTGLSFAVHGRKEMTTMLNNCMNNRMMDRPDVLLCGQTPYEYYDEEVTTEQKQIVNKKLGDAGFEYLQFKGIPLIWSPAITTKIYFLNTRFLYFVYDPMVNFDMTDWKAIPAQINDRAAHIVIACAFIVTRRICQGAMHTIDTE